MGAIDDLLSSDSTNSVGSHTFIDADTIRNADGETFRLQGYDAPEISGIKGGQWKQGTAGGHAATQAITSLAEKQGFTNLVPALDADGEPMKDNFGRPIVELHDKNGRNFTTELLKSGVLKSGKHTTQEDLDAIAVADLWEEDNKGDDAFAQAAKMVSEGIKDETYGDIAFKKQAVNEAQYAANPSRYSSAVQFRKNDRTITNKSLNPMSDSWEQGWIGVKEASYGMLNLLGDQTGADAIAEIGEDGVARAQKQLQEYGTTITHYKEVNGFGSAIDFLTNNFALSLPYMAATVVGTAAAPLTYGASLALPVSIYAGQTWNEMEGENKNAGIAIGSGVVQAALDRLGLSFLFKSGIAPKKLYTAAVNELVRKGATKEAAEQTVASATRKEIAGFEGDVAQVAKGQLTGKTVFKELAKKAGVAGGAEGITEALQETTGYLAAHHKEGFDFNELNDRIINATLAGGTLGTTFGTTGQIINTGAWADLAYRTAPAEAKRLSQSGKFAEAERSKYGRVKSIDELNRETKAKADKLKPNEIASVQERIDNYEQSRKGRSVKDQIFEAAVSLPALWRGAVRNIFTPEILEKSRAARVVADMFGGKLQKTFSGSSYENAKHHKVSVYKNMVDQPEKVFSQLNDGKHANRHKRGEISARIYSKLNNAIDPQTKQFNPDLIPDNDPEKPLLVQLQSQLKNLGDTLYRDQKQFNDKLGYLNNYLLRYKAFNKKAIVKNKHAFVQALLQEFPQMTEAKANEIADAITGSSEINDIGEALDATQAAGKPGSHKKRSLDLAEKDRFKEFMEQDIFANVSQAAKSAARYTAQQEYLGDNNKQLAVLLDEMQKEGLSEAEVNKIASQMNNYLLAESGNYKRPTSDAGKNLQKIQRNFMMVVTMAGLPLATISSFVEAALSFRGLRKDQIFGKGQTLETMGKELGQTLWTGMSNVVALGTRKEVMPAATQGKEIIKNLGYYDWDVGAATVTGATEINPWQQEVYEHFFKWTGLQGWTNFTRAVRASIAGDYITGKLQIIFDAQGEPKTNEIQEAEEALRNIGINVDDMLQAYRGGGMFDSQMSSVIESNIREGTFNFINDAVALPQSANRPLIYQDPRFALFTQFQGFIATFTANHIPKLWGEYVKRGTPAMKYNAFAIMTTMIMLGFASQYLKDLIKYGKYREFGADEHPWLNTSEYFQRGIRASGLLGTGERVLDQFFPMYEERSEGVGDWLWNTTSGESPALGYAKRALKGGGKLLEGDTGGAAKEASRFIPGLGVLNFFRDRVESAGDNWNFKG